MAKTRDGVSSSTDFRISKDPFTPLSLSREANFVFILVIHLRGFRKEGIDIEINKDGNRIKISGKKHVEEMVMTKWMAMRKEEGIKEFKKVFRIPEIVVLDKIKARFNNEEGTLKITLPKKVKGITGLKIEEEIEEEKAEEPREEMEEETQEKKEPEAVIQPQEESIEEKEEEEPEREEIEEMEEEEEDEKVEEEEEKLEKEDEGNGERKRRRRRRKRCCLPFLAGSSLLMSIIFFIIHLIESKPKRK